MEDQQLANGLLLYCRLFVVSDKYDEWINSVKRAKEMYTGSKLMAASSFKLCQNTHTLTVVQFWQFALWHNLGESV